MQAPACCMHANRLVQTCGIKCALCLDQQLVQPALAEVHHVTSDTLVLTHLCVSPSDVPAGSAVTSQPGSAGTVTFVNGKCTVSVSPCLTVFVFLQHCQHVPLLTTCLVFTFLHYCQHVPLLTKVYCSCLCALLSACAIAGKTVSAQHLRFEPAAASSGRAPSSSTSTSPLTWHWQTLLGYCLCSLQANTAAVLQTAAQQCLSMQCQ